MALQIVAIVVGSLAVLTAVVFGLLWFDLWRQRRDAEIERIEQTLRDLFRLDDTQPIDIVDGYDRAAAEAREWARIERDLACDADFRAIATRLENEFPQP
jgi:hypothetical protein